VSRTVKGSKGAGFEFHRKPKRGYSPIGRWWRRNSHKVARRIELAAARKEEA
jgi:hypothetical protein